MLPSHGGSAAFVLFTAFVSLPCVYAATCEGLTTLETVGQVFGCGEELLHSNSTSKAQAQSIREVLVVLKDFREACFQGLHVNTVEGCQTLHSLVLEWVSVALYQLWTCEGLSHELCGQVGEATHQAQLTSWQIVKKDHSTGSAGLVSRSMEAIEDLIAAEYRKKPSKPASAELLPAWRIARLVTKELFYWVTALIWRETQWQWLSDSLTAEKVVHTAWGEPDEWLRFGETDCHAEAPLLPGGPHYKMNEEARFTGLRFQVLAALLKELRDRRGGGELVLIEVGVFIGELSRFIIEHTDFVRLIGVDPFKGADGTFPGHYSNLHPDLPLHRASQLYDSFGERGFLMPTTSVEAAESLPDNSVDALFIDGCHLYSCVKNDLESWRPKLRKNAEVLVAGHDFSPQWPGVVQAVHEERGLKDVTISTDWLFWWFEPPIT
ncbi:Hypothetical protein SCF082_LOCUS3023 [Durusdinium trenchii]|uniref:Uncharacterized protein n=1 Tax=Durusdinium trenchii TaxID=1381693 RepID=A0ABP0HS67_9DINO